MTGPADKWDQLLTTGGGLLADGDADDDWSGRRVGAFQLIERIGVGGMASVYRAERIDQFEQQVAIKVLAAELSEPEHQRRFVRERQILARLDHPGIARIIDGGVEDDRPYLVMELVAGQPLDDYLAAHSPEFSGRARLLAQIARAVQHAHRHAVVHQDLKPGNVLVRDDGEPKLLDFGIAGASDGSDAGSVLLTPLYAAPEQYGDAATSVATDIFQMGVMICRTLTGEHPFVADRQASVSEVRRLMAQGRLRDGLTGNLTGAARDDVDHILARCLAVDPADRYESIAHLKQDLGALADDRPLPGRLAEPGYRVRRALRGKRVELGVAAAFALAAVFAGGLVWRELEDRRAQAAESDENTAAMGEVVSEILQNIDPLTTGSEPLDDVISTANFEKLATATRTQPRVQRDMVISSGRALLDSGRFSDVVNLVEPLVAELESVEPRPARYAEYLSLLGYARYRAGEPRRGQQELRRADELQRAEPPQDPAVRASTLQRLALVERRIGNNPTARALIDESLVLLDGRSDRQQAQALSQRGLILTDAGDLEGALVSFQGALDLLDALPGDHAVRGAMTLSNMADTQRLAGYLEDAETNSRRALELLKDTVDNPQLVATAATTLGNVLMAREAYSDAGDRYLQALNAYRDALGPAHPRVGLVAHNLAMAQRLNGDCESALAHYDLSIQIAEASYPADHPELKETRRQRALCGG